MSPSLRFPVHRSISPSSSPHTVRISLAKCIHASSTKRVDSYRGILTITPPSTTYSMEPSACTSTSSLEMTTTMTTEIKMDEESTNTSTETTPPSDPVDNVELGDDTLKEEEEEEIEELAKLEQMSRPSRRRVDVISSTMNPMVEQLVADAAVIAVNVKLMQSFTKISMRKFDVEKEYCRYIKQYLDMQIGPYFHCICGRKFGAYVSASSSWSFCFRIEQYTFLVFRSNDTPIISRTASESSESRSSSSRKSYS